MKGEATNHIDASIAGGLSMIALLIAAIVLHHFLN